jgi:hypothetical protein
MEGHNGGLGLRWWNEPLAVLPVGNMFIESDTPLATAKSMGVSWDARVRGVNIAGKWLHCEGGMFLPMRIGDLPIIEPVRKPAPAAAVPAGGAGTADVPRDKGNKLPKAAPPARPAVAPAGGAGAAAGATSSSVASPIRPAAGPAGGAGTAAGAPAPAAPPIAKAEPDDAVEDPAGGAGTAAGPSRKRNRMSVPELAASLEPYLKKRTEVMQERLALPEVSGSAATDVVEWWVDPAGRDIFKAGVSAEMIVQEVFDVLPQDEMVDPSWVGDVPNRRPPQIREHQLHQRLHHEADFWDPACHHEDEQGHVVGDARVRHPGWCRHRGG